MGVVLLALLAWGHATPAYADQEVFRWQDPAISESSGLVVVGDRFVTVNDSGNGADLFVVDAATGENVEVLPWARRQVDVEGLAPGPDGSVWVGDIGDNAETRKRITATLVPLDGTAPTRYVLRYPDGLAHNAETLMAHPDTGQLFLVTKNPAGGQVYAAPEELDPRRPNRLQSVASIKGLKTDGAFWPSGDHVLLRGYGRAFLYTFPDFKVLGSFDLPSQPQGEAIAVTPAEEIYLSSEGAGTPVWRVDLPEELAAKMAGQSSADPTSSPTASPPASTPDATGEPDADADAEPDADADGAPIATLVGVGGVVVGLVGLIVWWRRGRVR